MKSIKIICMSFFIFNLSYGADDWVQYPESEAKLVKKAILDSISKSISIACSFTKTNVDGTQTVTAGEYKIDKLSQLILKTTVVYKNNNLQEQPRLSAGFIEYETHVFSRNMYFYFNTDVTGKKITFLNTYDSVINYQYENTGTIDSPKFEYVGYPENTNADCDVTY